SPGHELQLRSYRGTHAGRASLDLSKSPLVSHRPTTRDPEARRFLLSQDHQAVSLSKAFFSDHKDATQSPASSITYKKHQLYAIFSPPKIESEITLYVHFTRTSR